MGFLNMDLTDTAHHTHHELINIASLSPHRLFAAPLSLHELLKGAVVRGVMASLFLGNANARPSRKTSKPKLGLSGIAQAFSTARAWYLWLAGKLPVLLRPDFLVRVIFLGIFTFIIELWWNVWLAQNYVPGDTGGVSRGRVSRDVTEWVGKFGKTSPEALLAGGILVLCGVAWASVSMELIDLTLLEAQLPSLPTLLCYFWFLMAIGLVVWAYWEWKEEQLELQKLTAQRVEEVDDDSVESTSDEASSGTPTTPGRGANGNIKGGKHKGKGKQKAKKRKNGTKF